jgi:hypothetical protein
MLIDLGWESFVSADRCVGFFALSSLPEQVRRQIPLEGASGPLSGPVRTGVLTVTGEWLPSTLSAAVLARRSQALPKCCMAYTKPGKSRGSPPRDPVDGQENNHL